VVHGETGLLVPAGDPAALAAAIAGLLADPERRRRLGEAGRQRALKEFSIQPMTAGTADVYRRVIASVQR
jgi:glycosyltransferase involved in cell wall biosynthesis